MNYSTSVQTATKRELKATERIMIQSVTDFFLDFKFQEHIQETTGQFLPLDALEMTRKMLNLFSITEHRLNLLEAQEALKEHPEIDTLKLQSVFKVKIEPIE